MKKVSKEKSLVINTIIIFISKVFTQLISIILLPIVTGRLSTGDYGAYDLITVYGLFITAFMGLNIENGLFRFLINARNDESKQKKIISSGIFSMFIITVIVSIIYIMVWLIIKFNNSILIYIYAFSSLYFNMFLQITRGLGDNLNYAISSIIVGIGNIIFSILFLFVSNMGLYGLIYASSLSFTLGSVYLLVVKKVYKLFSIKYLNLEDSFKIMKYSVPLVPNSISSWTMNISDKIMLSYFIGNSATGIYSISTKFPTLLSHIYSVFNLSWTESASVNIEDSSRNDFFSKVINKIFIICVSFCMLTLAAMPIIFNLMIDKNFIDAYKFIPILILASTFEILSGLLGAVYISLMKSKNIAISTTITGIINILINLILIPKIGILAACISTLVSYFILSMYRYINILNYIKIKLDKKSILALYGSYIIITFLYFSNSIIFYLISIVFCTLVICLLNRQDFIKIYNFINKKLRYKIKQL